MIEERGGEDEFLFRSGDRILHGRGAELCDEVLRQRVDRGEPVVLARLHDLHQRRPTERGDAEEPGAEGGARLASQCCQIAIPEHEGPRHRPLTRLGRLFENEGVGGIKPYGAQQPHARGPRRAGSYQAGAAKRGNNCLRSTLALPMRRTNRSPLSSMSRRSPPSRGSHVRHLCATAPKPFSCQPSTATMKCRAKLSSTLSDIASVKPSSSSAVTSGLSPGPMELPGTVRILAQN